MSDLDPNALLNELLDSIQMTDEEIWVLNPFYIHGVLVGEQLGFSSKFVQETARVIDRLLKEDPAKATALFAAMDLPLRIVKRRTLYTRKTGIDLIGDALQSKLEELMFKLPRNPDPDTTD